jgi:transcriptional regulator with XRE-family HTH domain
MELGKQIKYYREEAKISQEELGNRVFVSRQTISNWENDKSYPDVNSLVLLSEVFQISIDKLIKGDIGVMKTAVKAEIVKFKYYNRIYIIALIALIVLTTPLIMWLGYGALIPISSFFSIAVYSGLKVNRIKNNNDVYTYKEVIAFCDGKLLDEIQKQREIGKRPYQKFIFVLCNAMVAFLVALFMSFLVRKWGLF